MNVVDSSGWLDYFSGGVNAKHFAEPIEDTEALIVPTITVFEVFKVILREFNEETAARYTAHMRTGLQVNLNESLAIQAATLSHQHKIPMPDSIILTTARAYDAVVWTQDNDFENLANVRYFPKRRMLHEDTPPPYGKKAE